MNFKGAGSGRVPTQTQHKADVAFDAPGQVGVFVKALEEADHHTAAKRMGDALYLPHAKKCIACKVNSWMQIADYLRGVVPELLSEVRAHVDDVYGSVRVMHSSGAPQVCTLRLT